MTSQPTHRAHAILLIGPYRADSQIIEELLSRAMRPQVVVRWERRLDSALDLLRREDFQAIFIDVALTADIGGRILAALGLAAPGTPIVGIADPGHEPPKSRRGERLDYIVRGRFEFRSLADLIESLIAQKAADAASFAEKERAEVTLNSIGDGVLCTDQFGRVTYLNPIAERMTSWPIADAIGKPSADVFRIIDGNTREPVRDPLQRAIRDDKPTALTANCILVRRDGVESAIEDSIAPIHDRSGNVTGAVAVFRDVSAARAVANKMSHLAQHDFLTDLPNRVLFNDRLMQAIAMARRHQRQLGVLFLDVDNFKDINDTLGHVVGDLLLQSIAKRLVSAGRLSDTVSRQGGDEFVILLSELEKPADADVCARKIIRALAAPHRIGAHDLHVTASMGVSLYPQDGRNAEALLHSADVALYEAKQGGRNTYRSFRSSMKGPAIERQSVEGSLLRALERKEFLLHYQPRVDLSTGGIVGVEALIRWNHPERGLVPPADFVPVAEDCGLIVPIGRWVAREACLQAAHWRNSGLAFGTMAVNVSAIEFRNAEYLNGIGNLIVETGLDPSGLELELTETVLMQDADAAHETLKGLTGLGIRLTLDDFGTGYSSLSYLHRFPINTLKIDRSFVQEIHTNVGNRTLVATIISMGRNLGHTVIAEGVETEDQLNILRDLTCHEGQGYHFCRPLSADDFTTYLVASRARTDAGNEHRVYAVA